MASWTVPGLVCDVAGAGGRLIRGCLQEAGAGDSREALVPLVRSRLQPGMEGERGCLVP